MDYDDVLKNVGQFGRFQKYILALIAIPCMISCWQSFLHAFIGFIPPHRCWIDNCDNLTSSYKEAWLNATTPYTRKDGVYMPDQCEHFVFNYTDYTDVCPPKHLKTTVKCSKYKFDDSEFSSTIATEWNLYCDKQYLVSLAGSVNLAGGFVGSLLMGTIADRYGRKTAILICLGFLAIFGVSASVAPSVVFFMIARFCVEAMESSLYYVSFVLVMEFIGPDKRVLVSQIIQLIYSFGEMTLAGIAYLVTDWSYLQLVTSVPALLFLVFYWILPESGRWLLAKGRTDDADKIIQKMMKWNKCLLKDETVQYGTVQSDSTPKPLESTSTSDTDTLFDSTKHSYSMIDLFRTPRLRLRTILLMLCWFLNVLVYTGVTLGATSVAVNSAFLSFFLSGFVEIPANLLSIFTMSYFGRRITLCGSFALTGVALISIQFVPNSPDYSWVLLLLTLLGKFGSTVGNSVLYLFSAELFPTVLRNSGLGLCGFISTIASTIAPQMQIFSRVAESLPYIVFGIASLIGGFASLSQPETLKKNLPQTIEDAENFGR
uniref:Major facilitator superfamily (MFS) profile domain-containing protein n=1 Tax=Strigamia maritima TaxID=126957 RepID=T1J4N1_STRMM